MSTHCWFWHRWPKWSTPKEVVLRYEGMKETRPAWLQERTCADCGKYETRLERI